MLISILKFLYTSGAGTFTRFKATKYERHKPRVNIAAVKLVRNPPKWSPLEYKSRACPVEHLTLAVATTPAQQEKQQSLGG
jgi:hypothetical protein